MRRNDPVLHTVPIKKLRPTQMTLGLIEVEIKRQVWRGASEDLRAEILRNHVVPGVLGPKERFYLIDHHHLVRALYEEDHPGVFIQTLADYSKLSQEDFWVALDHQRWVHTYDREGARAEFSDIPHHIKDLEDDPYRSLAGAVRRAGGFAKDVTPYAEFLWAAYFRSRVKRALIAKNFQKAVQAAHFLAHDKDADYLPGWCGRTVLASRRKAKHRP